MKITNGSKREKSLSKKEKKKYEKYLNYISPSSIDKKEQGYMNRGQRYWKLLRRAVLGRGDESAVNRVRAKLYSIDFFITSSKGRN
jgi:hypothetical protein